MRNKQAYLILISCMLVWGSIGIFRRSIPLSSGLLAFARGMLGAGFLLLLVKLQGRALLEDLERKQLLLLIFSGICIGINWICLFEAYNCTTVSTATLCYSMQPTFTILLSWLLLREKLTPKKFCCAAVSVIGISLVSGTTESTAIQFSDLKGIVFGLAAAFLYSSIVILNKKITCEDAYGRTMVQLFSAAVVLLPYLVATEDFTQISLDTVALLLLLFVGFIHTGIAYAAYFACLEYVKAQSVAVLSYLDPVTGLVLSAVILHEQLTLAGAIGAVLIIGAALISEINFRKKAV